MMPIPPMSALVLGGRRGGHIDPLASGVGVSDKCLVPVNGHPMISHVLETLHSISEITRIIVSVNDPEILRPLPIVDLLENEKRIEAVRSSRDLLSSIVEGVSLANFPLLITTADNVFLSRQSIAEIADGASASSAPAAPAAGNSDATSAAYNG